MMILVCSTETYVMEKTVELYKACLNKKQNPGPELISLRQNYMYRQEREDKGDREGIPHTHPIL